MNRTHAIAVDEWRLMRRNRVAVVAALLLVVLTVIAALTAYERQRAISIDRASRQAEANEEFDTQPNRHPHRVVHYGHFVFRPLSALAAFDPGVDAYTGNTLFLEGHRQNSANFGDVRQSSLLLRFGQLTPAFVLQTLVPLLLIFLGFGVIARERERGTMRLLFAQGVTARQLLLGKLRAVLGLGALIAAPAFAALLAIAFQPSVPTLSSLLIAAGYAGYLLVWALVVVLASALAPRSRDALLGLFAFWAVTVILLPRVLPDVSRSQSPLATRFETDIVVERDLKAMGDSHNPNDPYFDSFKKKILAQYGVTRVEDLPVNYKGVLGIEGERMTSALYDRRFHEAFDRQSAQNRFVDGFGVVSPIIALRRLSMTAADTDLGSHRRFLEQSEQYRYDFVQTLNRMQAEKLRYADDIKTDRENRIDKTNWQDFPDFVYRPRTRDEVVAATLPALGLIALWIAVLGLLAIPVSRRLERAPR